MWNRTRQRAAELVAAGDLSSEQIAKELGISDRSLRRWKQEPEFEARVKAVVLQWRTKIASTGIAVRENRIAGYERRRNWLEQIRTAPFGLGLKRVIRIGGDPNFELDEQ